MKKNNYLLPALGLAISLSSTAFAANHREAPLTALDHKVDITDVYAFVSYDNPDKITLIMNVDPLLEPSNGPTRFPFDPEILYSIKIDNNHDAIEDVSFDFRFKTEFRQPDIFVGLFGAGNGLVAPENSPQPVLPGTPIFPAAITALTGPGSEGLNLSQQYEVTMSKYYKGKLNKHDPKTLSEDLNLYAVPSNVGPRTMPDYEDLSNQGIYDLGEGIKVYAATIDDPFYIDLGAVFDSFNLRTAAFDTGIPGVLTDAQDNNDQKNFAPDDIAGFNVNSIAIEIPIALISQDGQRHNADEPEATIGVWATTSRPSWKSYGFNPDSKDRTSSKMSQRQRMANPLVNELLIGIGSKDLFSKSQPKDDAQFADFVLDPVLARVLNALYDTIAPGVLPVPDAPRTDLLPLVQYMPPVAASGTPLGPIADLLRLNTGIPATAMENRSRLGFLTLLDDDLANDDPAGFPNGRRVSDDVVDITTRVVLGILAGSQFSAFPHNRVGDGVNQNDVPYRETFPYVGLANSGVESRHIDTGESGCTETCP